MKISKPLKITLIIILVLLLAGAGAAIWLSRGQLTDSKLKAFKTLPFPMALVNNRVVSMKSFVDRYETAKIFYAKSPEPVNDADLKKGVADKMIEEEKIKQLASRKGVSVAEGQITEEFDARAKQANLEGSQNFIELLKSYGMTEKQYREDVIKPDILTTNLVVWFNKQKALNEDSYKLAESLQNRISQGETMDNMAKNFSQDEASKLVEGDLGFVEITNILPELKEELDTMNTGQTKLVISRYGIHLMNLEEKDNNGPDGSPRLHIRQIFVKPGDFANWFKEETKDYSVKNIVKI